MFPRQQRPWVFPQQQSQLNVVLQNIFMLGVALPISAGGNCTIKAGSPQQVTHLPAVWCLLLVKAPSSLSFSYNRTWLGLQQTIHICQVLPGEYLGMLPQGAQPMLYRGIEPLAHQASYVSPYDNRANDCLTTECFHDMGATMMKYYL